MSLTVEEILALPGLEEMTLRAGARNRQRSVRWSYVAENEGIAGWVMGGELVFVTGINHPRDEANLLRLIDEGSDCAIAGLVILTGETFIHSIPPSVIALAEARGVPLIEQPYLLRMVIVTHLIGTALVQMAQTKRSRHDILAQLLSGDYPAWPPSASAQRTCSWRWTNRAAWLRYACQQSVCCLPATHPRRQNACCSTPARPYRITSTCGAVPCPARCR